MLRSRPRRLLTYAAVSVGLVLPIAVTPAATTAPQHKAPILNLETLTGPQAEKMMEEGKLTSVELTQMYLDRIHALNKSGPGLNAVTQINPDALKEAALADKERADGKLLGPAHGLPILLKDIVDATPMYTSAGNYSLRKSFPAEDSGVTKKLREHGLVILGKTGLSEFANSFGNQPSGFSNLTGQVVNAIDADQNPSGSSSGSGSAGAAALAMFTIGTETSGSIISPSSTQGIVGLRPTVGLVPGYGIAPILASQDTAGPMERTVSDVAMVMQSIAGADPESDKEYTDVFGPNYLSTGVIPTPPAKVPDYMSALDLNFVKGKKIGYNGTLTPGTPLALAYDTLVKAGAIMVLRPQTTTPTQPTIPAGYEAHKTIDAYYTHLGPKAPIKSLVDEVTANNAEAGQALKFGNATHLSESLTDLTAGGANEVQFRTNLPLKKAIVHKTIDDMMNYTNSDPTQALDPVIAVLGTVPNGPAAGYPQITVPMSYVTTTRRAQSVSLNGGAYDERNLIGVAYVLEQGTKLRQPASMVDPAMYRCAHTVPAEPFAARGHCNPDYDTIMGMLGTSTPQVLPFSLETESAQSLEARMASGSLTAEQLVKAYLYRIALTNAEGPAIQAVRSLNTNAIAEAKAIDKQRKAKVSLGPLMGIPVLLDDTIDVKGMATTGGSIALQDSMPAADATIVAKLKAAGAIVLGKTNVTELNGLFDSNIPEGYSSLGGQVFLPSDTDKTPAGSSAGSAAATAAGLAALTIGVETSTDTAQLIAPAGVAGVVGLKPTVGLVSRTGILPVAKSQDAPGAIGRTVYDVASALNVMTGPDSADAITASSPTKADYTSGLSWSLAGKKIAVISNSTAPYPSVVAALQGQGATTTVVTIGTPSTPASIVGSEFKRDVNAYLGTGHTGGAKSLAEIISYNTAHPVEGLKYQQGELVAADSVDLTNAGTASAYVTNLTSGRAAAQAALDSILNNGTPGNTSDDYDAIVVPSGDPAIGYADRAGYPMLTVPAGYGVTASGAGHNPIGITFIGTAGSEAKLLGAGYAFEKVSSVRIAPSITNPSMWRCVAGSSFFTAELCHPGDRQLKMTSAKLATLRTWVGSMGLKFPLTADLTTRITDIGNRVSYTTETCGTLGISDLLQKVLTTASSPSPGLSISQAQGIVSTVNTLKSSVGCDDATTASSKASAEQGLLSLSGTLDAMHLPKATTSGLFRSISDAGLHLAHNSITHACSSLSALKMKISMSKGLSTAQASELKASQASIASGLSCS